MPFNQWVMIWQAWADNSLYIATNADISNPMGWDTPKFLVSSINGGRAWHATVVCEGGGSSWCARTTARLHYADRWSGDRRDFVSRVINFARYD